MTGDDDPLVPHDNSHILKELMPHAELFVFPGGHHCVMIEKADQYNKKVIEFFKSTAAKPTNPP
jgi:pimeloyl-ACP methyl ester carboxylesterase